MNDKRVRGNKEVKKPKQAPRVVPPPTGGVNAPPQSGWQKKQQQDRK